MHHTSKTLVSTTCTVVVVTAVGPDVSITLITAALKAVSLKSASVMLLITVIKLILIVFDDHRLPQKRCT
jgi:hypothetical protein